MNVQFQVVYSFQQVNHSFNEQINVSFWVISRAGNSVFVDQLVVLFASPFTLILFNSQTKH